MKIYVGNLSYETTEEDIKSEFEKYGEIKNINLITDTYSGKSKGFGFVEMSEKADAEKAIANLNGKDLKGRKWNVNEARPKNDSFSGGNRPQNKSFRKF